MIPRSGVQILLPIPSKINKLRPPSRPFSCRGVENAPGRNVDRAGYRDGEGRAGDGDDGFDLHGISERISLGEHKAAAMIRLRSGRAALAS